MSDNGEQDIVNESNSVVDNNNDINKDDTQPIDQKVKEDSTDSKDQEQDDDGKQKKDEEETSNKKQGKDYSYLLENDTDAVKEWYYLDSKDIEIGPLTFNNLLYLYKTSSLHTDNVQIRKESQYKYHSIQSNQLFQTPDETTQDQQQQSTEDNNINNNNYTDQFNSIYSNKYTDYTNINNNSNNRYHPYAHGNNATTTSTQQQSSSSFQLPQYKEYTVTGTFNKRTGKFDSSGKSGTWSSYEERIMSHYFDLDQYQQQNQQLLQQQQQQPQKQHQSNKYTKKKK